MIFISTEVAKLAGFEEGFDEGIWEAKDDADDATMSIKKNS